MISKTEILLEGLAFPESPRWHNNKLWFSDMVSCKVMTVDNSGNVETIIKVPKRPSGLGWLPDGILLIVSMEDRRLLRLDGKNFTEVADLSKLATFHCNDMVVDKLGRAYIGNFGFDYVNQKPFALAKIILVKPEGVVQVIADKMAFPNGTVITPDDSTLIVGETFGNCLTAFTIMKDGSLTERRIWANLKDLCPDGICLDADGAIWVAAPRSASVVRVLEGGEITHTIKVSSQAYACMLGGHDRRTLFVTTSEENRTNGRIEFIKVDVPGAGLP